MTGRARVGFSICIVGVLLRPTLVAAQDSGLPAPDVQTPAPRAPAHNAIYGELFGNGFMYSANYEHRLGESPFWGRVGFETFAPSRPVIPLMIELVLGDGSNHLELGAGVLTWSRSAGRRSGMFRHVAALPVSVIGFRHQRPNGGLIFRAGLTPFLVRDEDFPWPWFGVSVGRSF